MPGHDTDATNDGEVGALRQIPLAHFVSHVGDARRKHFRCGHAERERHAGVQVRKEIKVAISEIVAGCAAQNGGKFVRRGERRRRNDFTEELIQIIVQQREIVAGANQ